MKEPSGTWALTVEDGGRSQTRGIEPSDTGSTGWVGFLPGEG